MARSVTTGSNYLELSGTAVINTMPITMVCRFRILSGIVAGEGSEFMSIGLDGSSNQEYWTLGFNFFNSPGLNDVRAGTRGGGAPGVATVTTTDYNLDTWHHASATFVASNDRSAYLDGGGSGLNTTTRDPEGSDEKTGLFIGFADDPNSDYDVQNASFFSETLDDDQLLSLSAGYHAYQVDPWGLVAHVPLVSGTGVAADIVGGFSFAETGTVGQTPGPIIPGPCRAG